MSLKFGKILRRFIDECTESVFFVSEAFLQMGFRIPYVAHNASLAVAILTIVGAAGIEIASPSRILARLATRLINCFSVERHND